MPRPATHSFRNARLKPLSFAAGDPAAIDDKAKKAVLFALLKASTTAAIFFELARAESSAIGGTKYVTRAPFDG